MENPYVWLSVRSSIAALVGASPETCEPRCLACVVTSTGVPSASLMVQSLGACIRGVAVALLRRRPFKVALTSVEHPETGLVASR